MEYSVRSTFCWLSDSTSHIPHFFSRSSSEFSTANLFCIPRLFNAGEAPDFRFGDILCGNSFSKSERLRFISFSLVLRSEWRGDEYFFRVISRKYSIFFFAWILIQATKFRRLTASLFLKKCLNGTFQNESSLRKSYSCKVGLWSSFLSSSLCGIVTYFVLYYKTFCSASITLAAFEQCSLMASRTSCYSCY